MSIHHAQHWATFDAKESVPIAFRKKIQPLRYLEDRIAPIAENSQNPGCLISDMRSVVVSSCHTLFGQGERKCRHVSWR